MSDQDFFFDEEEDAKPAPKKAQVAQKQSAAPVVASGGQSFFEQDVPMLIAALMTAIALLVGILVGVLIPTGSKVANSSTSAPTAPAPQLTQDQINSGQIPANHPDLGGMTGSGVASGSAETTAK